MIREQIEEILAKVAPEGTTVELSVPEREEFGHYATSLAMKMAGRRLTQISPDAQITNEMKMRVFGSGPIYFFA